MFAKKLSLALIACSFLSAGCIVTSAEDDDGIGGTETPTTETPTTTVTPTTATTGEDSTGFATTDETTTATTGEPGGCGWGPLSGNDQVPNGYQCGIDGEIDPAGTHPIACPDAADLTLGADCTAAMVTAEGCCDANGDVWFCVDPDGDGPDETEVSSEDCADPVDPTGDTDSATTGDTDTDTDTATTGDTDTDTATTGEDTGTTTTAG